MGTVVALSSDVVMDIPVKSILAVKDAHCRGKVDEDRVKEIAKVLKEGEDLRDPIVVAPIPGHGAQEKKYWLLDGWYAFESAKLAGRTNIRAKIDRVVLPEFNGDEITKEVLFKSALYNFHHLQYPLSGEEKREVVSKLYNMGYTVKDLTVLASERSIHYWTRRSREEETARKQKTALNLLSEGRSQSEVSRITGIPRQTITDWASGKKLKNNGNGGLPQSATALSAAGQDRNILLKNNNTATAPQSTAPSDAPAESISTRPLEKMNDEISGMSWGENGDTYVLSHLLPTLKQKSRTINAAISDRHYPLVEKYADENKRLTDEVRGLLRQLHDLRKENDELREKARKSLVCDKECEVMRRLLRDMFLVQTKGIAEEALLHLKMLSEEQEPSDLMIKVTRSAVACIASSLQWAQMQMILQPEDIKIVEKFEAGVKKIGEEGRINGNEIVARAIRRVSAAREFFAA